MKNKGQFVKGQTPWNSGTGIKLEIYCPCCEQMFIDYKSNNRRFCSKSCSAKMTKNKKGVPLSENHKKAIALNNKKRFANEQNVPAWKGKYVGYSALHKWVRKHLGTPNKCETCGNVYLRRR